MTRFLPRLFLTLGIAAATAIVPLHAPAQEATPVAADCTVGSSSFGDPYFAMLGNAGYDVQHYTLDLELDVPAGAISAGRATIAAVALANLCAFSLDFQGLEITELTVDGSPAAFARNGGELTITPATPLVAGAPFTAEVVYRGVPLRKPSPPIEAIDTDLLRDTLGAAALEQKQQANAPDDVQFGSGWWAGDDEIFIAGEPAGAETWYPVNGHPADKATYTLRLTVPDPFVVVANGTLIETIETGTGTTTVWESRDPMASYVVTFHAGRLFVDTRVGPGGLPIRISSHESVPAAQRVMFDRLPEMITYFESVFGPYPFASVGGTIVGPFLPFALETQTMPIFPNWGLEEIPDFALEPLNLLVAHELAHQWFGNSVSLMRWQDIWLNEGFARYAEALWIEHTEGSVALSNYMARLHASVRVWSRYLDPDHVAELNAREVIDDYQNYSLQHLGQPVEASFLDAYRTGLGVATPEELESIPAERGLVQLVALGATAHLFPAVTPSVGDPGPGALFSLIVYDRGALTLHALRLTVGDDAFFTILREWTTRFGDGNASTAEFIALAEEVSGEELDRLFESWLFEPGLPELPAAGTGSAMASPVTSVDE